MVKKPRKNALPPISGAKKRDKKRQLILHCAAALFNKHGPRATKLSDITGQLGLTKTSLYYYAKNKEELIYLCYKEACEKFEHLIEASASEHPQDFLATFFDKFISYWADVLSNKAVAIAVLSDIHAIKDPYRSQLKNHYARLIERITSILKAEIDRGGHYKTDPFAAAHAFFSSIQWVVAWLTPTRLKQVEAIKAATADIIRNGLTARPRPLSDATLSLVEKRDLSVFRRHMPHDMKLEAFIAEACTQFNQKGYHGTSIDSIAENLSVTKGAFYYYIRNKEHLLSLCFERSVRKSQESLKWAAKHGKDGLDKMCLALGSIFGIQNSTLGPLIAPGLLLELGQITKAKVISDLRQLSSDLGSIIEEGIRDRSIRPVDPFVAESILMGALLSGDRICNWRDIEDMRSEARNYLRTFIIGTHPKIGTETL